MRTLLSASGTNYPLRMFKTILLVIHFAMPNGEYDETARYNDSLLIYNAYHPSVEFLKTMKESDRQKWYQMEADIDRITACAKMRLKKHNHKEYEPVLVFDRVGMGTAFAYPKPGTSEHVTPQAFTKNIEPKYHFVVYDKQTRFMSVKDCALKIPYILKLVFDKGRLLFADKLNPVTMEKL